MFRDYDPRCRIAFEEPFVGSNRTAFDLVTCEFFVAEILGNIAGTDEELCIESIAFDEVGWEYFHADLVGDVLASVDVGVGAMTDVME